MAIGEETLHRLARQLPHDLRIGLVPQEHRFRSVNGTSSTSHLATIPTSLGNKGSLLRPAIFQEGESRKAPFLISLPFWLHCRSVLHLDPQRGPRLHLRRFGFGVDCHIGPTGALRLPLNQFTEDQKDRLQQLHEQLQHESEEFEILKTAPATNNGSKADSSILTTGPTVNSRSTHSHEALPDRGEPLRKRLGSVGRSAPLRADQDHRTGHFVDGPEDLRRHHGGDRSGGDRHGGNGAGTSTNPRTKQGLQPVAKDDLLREEQPGDSGIPVHHPSESNSTVCLRREEPNQLPPIDTLPKHSRRSRRTPRTARTSPVRSRISRVRKSAIMLGPPNGAVEKCVKRGKVLKSERKDTEPEAKTKDEQIVKEELTDFDQKEKAEFNEFLEYQKWKAEKKKETHKTSGNKK